MYPLVVTIWEETSESAEAKVELILNGQNSLGSRLEVTVTFGYFGPLTLSPELLKFKQQTGNEVFP